MRDEGLFSSRAGEAEAAKPSESVLPRSDQLWTSGGLAAGPYVRCDLTLVLGTGPLVQMVNSW